MAAAELDEAVVAANSKAPMHYLIAALAQLVMAFILAGTIGHLGSIEPVKSVITALFIWAGFVVTTLSVNYTFQMRKRQLILIDGGHWLLVFVIQAFIIG